MGYSHFNGLAVTGSSGLAVGTASAGETRVMSSSGAITAPAGAAITGSSGVTHESLEQAGIITHMFNQASTATLTSVYYTAPYACNVSGYVTYSLTGGTGRLVSVAHGSAGDDALALSSNTGALAQLALTASANVAFAAGDSIRVHFDSCGTAQTYVGLTILLTKTS